MKEALVYAALAVALISVDAMAAGMGFEKNQPIYRAELTRFNADPTLDSMRVNSGMLSVDMNAGQVSLLLNRGFYCPKGRICTQIMPGNLEVSAPIIAESQDACGVRKILARQGVEELEVRDNTKNTCSRYVQLADTEVIYTHGAADHRERSKFEAGRLEAFEEQILERMDR